MSEVWTPREFVKKSRFSPEQAIAALVTDDGILGLRLGMTKDEVRALGFSHDKNGKAWIELDGGVLHRVRYEYYSDAYAGPDAFDQLVEAWTAKYGAPVERGRWDTGAGIISAWIETIPELDDEKLIVEFEPGQLACGLEAFDAELLEAKIRAFLDDLIARGVAAVDLESKGGALAIAVSFAGNDDKALRLVWSDAPMSTRGELSDSLANALQHAGMDLFTAR